MARYTTDSVERVRDAIDMAELVGARVELRRSGPGRLTGLCPFHEERTPSFGIETGRKLYHCFGCGAGGDAFDFVMQTEGVDFAAALELLADRYRVPLELEDEDPEAARRRQRSERLLELLDRTASFYERMLWDSPAAAAARSYLADRGLSQEALRRYRVGFAPDSYERVLSASRAAGYSEEELVACGLAVRGRESGRLIDRFRGRIAFPLADARGRVRGFGARALKAGDQPKYLNSGESEIFHKRRQLFGADVARAEAAREGDVILVEGYTDVIALHQAGVRNVVAAMGTSLTEEQARELARLAPRLVLAMDADGAGRAAMVRAARMARAQRVEPRVLPLPGGSDPADLAARESAEQLRERVGRSVGFAEFHVGLVLDTADLGSAEGKDAALAELAPIVRELPVGVRRGELTRLIASRMNIPAALVGQVIDGARARAPRAAPEGRSGGSGAGAEAGSGSPAPAREEGGRDGPAPAAAARAPQSDAARSLARGERTERAFLALCIALPERGGEALASLDLDEHFTDDLTRRAAAHLRSHIDAPLASLPPRDEDLARMLAELSVRADTTPADEDSLEVERLQLERSLLDRRIAAARAADARTIPDLARARAAIQDRLDTAIERASERSPTLGR